MNPLTQKSPKLPAASRLLWLAVAALAALPAVLFYAILVRTAVNIPFYDDYDSVLDFMNRLMQLPGSQAKAAFFLAWQHNEYKLFLGQALVWLQFRLFGHLNFFALGFLGNATLLFLALLLYRMFLPQCKDQTRRLALFLPVPCLLFQLAYYETLNWSMAGLANLPVILFSLAAIDCLWKTTRKAFVAALAFYFLAIASLSSGFLLLPIGLLILAVRRRFARILAWLLVSAGAIAAYAYHFSAHPAHAPEHHLALASLLRLGPLYAIGFMGSAASIPFPNASFVLGGVLCLFFAWMVWKGYARRNPLVSSCVLFLLLTALGVAGIRSDLGLAQSLSSRYTIYSALLVIFAWFVLVEEFLQHSRVPLLSSGPYLAAVLAAVSFCLFMDAVGYIPLEGLKNQLILGMTTFEHPDSPDSVEGPDIPARKRNPARDEFSARAHAILVESIRLGVYTPPSYPLPKPPPETQRQ